MAPSTVDSVPLKANSGSDSRQRVRIVARVRASTDFEIESSSGLPRPWISVRKPEPESYEGVTISFGDQATSCKESFKLDYCYDQVEDVGQIYSREVKPLVSGIFQGLNASVLAYGAKGSGKTHTIQGSNEKPGLAPLAMAEILSIAEEDGSSVTISSYEVCQDHVYDLLEPKGQEVLVLEGAGGKIRLKGLSQVPVKSVLEFCKFYFHGCTSRKPAQKVTNDASLRSHKGLIIHVSRNDKDSNARPVGKINFVDLTGHESARMNKSLYALQNVVYALNANERVPFRESKITHMLQDSLGGTSQTLMVICLNPYCCQDTINTVSWASRSCHVVNRVGHDSTKKTKTGARPMAVFSPKAGRPQTLSISAKKNTISQLKSIEKKPNVLSSSMKGRKLFDGTYPTSNSVQEKSSLKNHPVIQPSIPKEENYSSEVSSAVAPPLFLEERNSSSDVSTTIAPSHLCEEETSLATVTKAVEAFITNENEHEQPEVKTKTECNVKALTAPEEECCNIEKENKGINESESPPLSARLRELSNSLKSLCSTTPLSIKMPMERYNSSCHSQVFADVVESKTPKVKHNERLNDSLDVAKFGTPNFGTPRETFNLSSSGLKNSLVQEYLKFLNTANKEELKGMKGIGEKRANYILELREDSPEPFKDLNDLRNIGLTTKQINAMMKKVAGELFI